MAEEKPSSAAKGFTIDFKPLSLTIVELLGAALPGLVWLFLAATLVALLSVRTGIEMPPLWVLRRSLLLFRATDKEKVTTLVWIISIASLLVGWSVKPIVMRTADRICARFDRREGETFKDARAPYVKRFDGGFLDFLFKHVYGRLGLPEELRGSEQGETSDKEAPANAEKSLPTGTIFPICRRLIRATNPTLWAELEHREAEVRMIGSLFLGALFSAACSVLWLAILLSFQRSLASLWTWAFATIWLVASILVAYVLGAGFRYLRFREVQYVYINYLIAASERGKPESAPPLDREVSPSPE
jgi:hypothetical protein